MAMLASERRESVIPRTELIAEPIKVTRSLLGCVLESTTPVGVIQARVVEVEAYFGSHDPASHSFRGRTPRNAVMWGPAGHLYVYFVYGMHFCANVVTGPEGEPGAVLLRAAEIISGMDIVRGRRHTPLRDNQLAQGPARLTTALGIGREHNGIDLLSGGSSIRLRRGESIPDSAVRAGPRVGVSAAMDRPWRLWIDRSPAVSAYRRGGRNRSRQSATSDKTARS